MKKMTIKRGKTTATKSPSFFSMKVNPSGMSVGNFVDNAKRTASSFKSGFSTMKKTTRTRKMKRY